MSEPKLTRRQKAELALKDPNMRRMLNVISYAEGTEKHGYHTNFGGSRLEDLSWHPNRVLGRTKDGVTTATGRYQFLGSTFNEQAKKLGLQDFGPESQDLAAVGLIMDNGALDDVLKGDVTKAAYKLRHIWASLPDNPSKNQPHKTHAEIINAWNKNGGNADPAFTPPNSSLYQMNGQQYDYSTTQPNTNLAQTFFPQTEVQQNNPFSDYIPQSETLTAFQEPEPKQSNQQKYANELANAFGAAPSTESLLPDYIGDLVRSIFDQTV